MEINYNNTIIETEIIGGFKINQKEYAVLSYIDSNEIAKIVIVEVYRNGNELKSREIPKDEIDFVLEKYKELESKIMEEEI